MPEKRRRRRGLGFKAWNKILGWTYSIDLEWSRSARTGLTLDAALSSGLLHRCTCRCDYAENHARDLRFGNLGVYLWGSNFKEYGVGAHSSTKIRISQSMSEIITFIYESVISYHSVWHILCMRDLHEWASTSCRCHINLALFATVKFTLSAHCLPPTSIWSIRYSLEVESRGAETILS